MNSKWRSVLGYAVTKVMPAAGAVAVIGWIVATMLGVFEPKVEPARVERQIRTVDGAATDEVHEVTKPYVEEAVGALKAATRTAVSAKVLAVIEEIKVTAGSQVNAGDVLVRLDARELEARVQQAKQNLAAAKARRVESDANFRRVRELRGKNVVPQAELEQAQAKLEVDQAAEITAEQSVKEAETQLSYATLTAPKSGRVVERLAEEGDTARPGEPLLTLYDAASLRLEAPVQENLAVRLRVGQKLVVYIDALQREVTATIDEIVPQADAPSRSLLVKAAVPRSEDTYEGMFGRLRIEAGERRHLCLAADALYHVGQLDFVDVVLPDGVLEKRLVTVGRVGVPGRVEVLSGLQAGEQVVLRGSDVAEESTR